MLSIIFPSRAKNNPDFGLYNLIKSIHDTTTPEQREKIEVLVKFDSDDDLVPSELRNSSTLINDINIRSFFYARGEGRADINQVVGYLGSLVNDKCELIMNTADDFVFERTGWFEEVFKKYEHAAARNGGYIIFGEASTVTNVDYEHKPRWFTDIPAAEINEIFNCTANVNNTSLNRYIGEYCPIFSRKIFNTICGQFWMPSIDAYCAILNAMLVFKYNINIYSRLNNFYKRTFYAGDDRQQRDKYISSGGTRYNLNEISGAIGIPRNANFYALVEQQARNIYLNIKADGILQVD